MNSHDDQTLTYLYKRFTMARGMMADPALSRERRRDWAMRAEELRQCLRQMEMWRVERVGARYENEEVTSMEILPPRDLQFSSRN